MQLIAPFAPTTSTAHDPLEYAKSSRNFGVSEVGPDGMYGDATLPCRLHSLLSTQLVREQSIIAGPRDQQPRARQPRTNLPPHHTVDTCLAKMKNGCSSRCTRPT